MLSEQRKRIDLIDSEILKLFCERMKTVKEVAEIKLENNMQVLQPDREEQIIKLRGEQVTLEMKEYTEELFTAIMAISRQYQSKIIKEKGGEDA